jgi:hypothetical protein
MNTASAPCKAKNEKTGQGANKKQAKHTQKSSKEAEHDTGISTLQGNNSGSNQ